MRPLDIRLATDTFIQVTSPYVKKPSLAYKKDRHLLDKHWHLQSSATPLLYDKIGFCAALGPSYDIAHQTLTKFGVLVGLSTVRKISNSLAQSCYEVGEPQLAIQPNESLAGKRVAIALDGGRTRTHPKHHLAHGPLLLRNMERRS